MIHIEKINIVIALLMMGMLSWGCSSSPQRNGSGEKRESHAGADFFEHLQVVCDGYQNRFDYKGKLEKKYAAAGLYAVDTLTETSAEERIRLFQFYFPAELKTTDRQWPVVIMANGTGIRASKYRAIFHHLASWGFIVAGNEDEWTWDGRSVDMTLDYLLRANDDSESPFYQRIDTAHIGLTGHSQGGMAIYTAAALFDNSPRYKALCPLSATAKMLGDSLGWSFLTEIHAPMLMAGGCGAIDANLLCPPEHIKQTFDSLLTAPVIMGRIKDTDHGDMLPRGDAYMTAWMRYWLCGDQEAGKCFLGDSAELLGNESWQDIKRKGL